MHFFEHIFTFVKNIALWLWNDITVTQLILLILAITLGVVILRKPLIFIFKVSLSIILLLLCFLHYVITTPYRWVNRIKNRLDIEKQFHEIRKKLNY